MHWFVSTSSQNKSCKNLTSEHDDYDSVVQKPNNLLCTQDNSTVK